MNSTTKSAEYAELEQRAQVSIQKAKELILKTIPHEDFE